MELAELTHGEWNEVVGLVHLAIAQESLGHELLGVLPQLRVHVEGVEVGQDMCGGGD